mmetsp:Transcript_4984/g.11661  ORF Transcript_4984/g.11661 Transcript_4984/m.11661 type:complete len:203 (-) Transcript_4984:516-1124(-)
MRSGPSGWCTSGGSAEPSAGSPLRPGRLFAALGRTTSVCSRPSRPLPRNAKVWKVATSGRLVSGRSAARCVDLVFRLGRCSATMMTRLNALGSVQLRRRSARMMVHIANSATLLYSAGRISTSGRRPSLPASTTTKLCSRTASSVRKSPRSRCTEDAAPPVSSSTVISTRPTKDGQLPCVTVPTMSMPWKTRASRTMMCRPW